MSASYEYIAERLESMRLLLIEERMLLESVERKNEVMTQENQRLRDRLESLTAQIERMSNA